MLESAWIAPHPWVPWDKGIWWNVTHSNPTTAPSLQADLDSHGVVQSPPSISLPPTSSLLHLAGRSLSRMM